MGVVLNMVIVVLKNGRRLCFAGADVAELPDANEQWVVVRLTPTSPPVAAFPRENVEFVKFRKEFRKED